jgi:hypothetical protein
MPLTEMRTWTERINQRFDPFEMNGERPIVPCSGYEPRSHIYWCPYNERNWNPRNAGMKRVGYCTHCMRKRWRFKNCPTYKANRETHLEDLEQEREA